MHFKNVSKIFGIFYKNKNQKIPVELIEKKNPLYLDLSLRARGETYIDRDDEAVSIFKRIEGNSSSSIGIGGVRGAGKSSLAQKILDFCKKQKYFTILISSPTAYDPKEFLLTVYQNICEDVKLQLDELFKNKLTLEERGYKEIRKKKNQIRFILILMTVIFFSAYAFLFISAQKARMTELEQNLKNVKTQIQDAPADSLLSEGDHDRLLKLKDLYFDYQTELFHNDSKYSYLSLIIKNSNSIALFISFIGFLIIFQLFYFKPIRKFLYVQGKYPKESGLYSLTLNKLEGLIYQIKVSSSQEIGATLAQFSPKFSKGKEMESRPLSLPGLTADFNDYIDCVAQINNDKVVICIDELDKITDPIQLNELLKGIKGIIGHDKTHFILTVSEDALAKFSARLGSQRDLIESSFEEIYFLNRINLSLAEEIIKAAIPKSENEYSKYFRENCMLVWIFGNGIPREIKRSLVVLNSEEINIQTSHPWETWKILIKSLTEDMRSWALISQESEYDTYCFLICIENAIKNLPENINSHSDVIIWFRTLINSWSKYYKLPFTQPEQQHESPIENKIKISKFEKGLFEIALSSSALLLCQNEKEVSKKTILDIQNIFELIPYSPLFACYQFRKYLVNNGILENVNQVEFKSH